MREPAFAGTFYPATANALKKAVEDAFTGERGPGSLPPERQDRKVVAAIAPHAGYQYSGPAAAWVYHAIAASPRPDLFIILGPDHAAGVSAISMDTWKTPLGLVRADQEFVKALAQAGSVRIDEKAMLHEHSIEVQLPFLQYLLENEPERLKIAPIMVSNDVDLHQLALDIKETLVEQKKTATIIVSSDFTHHGPQYRYVRFSEEVAKNIYAFDEQIIALIKQQQPQPFLDFIDKELATVCGSMPIALLLSILKKSTMKLEQYYTSGDLLNDYKNSVSYAAIVFEGK
jgi:MEMO1 family protein